MQHHQGLLDRLTDWTEFTPLPDSFKPQRTIEAAHRVREKIDGAEAKPPPKYDLEELYKRVCDAWIRTKSLNDLAALDMKRLPWVLYFLPAAQTRPGSARMLGEDPEFIQCYGAWLAQTSKSAAVRALLYNFLGYYPRALGTFDSVREILLRELKASSTSSLNRWRTRCSDHGLLDRDGELGFLRSLTRSGEAIPSILDAAGLTGLLARSDFLKCGLLQYLREHAAAIVTERHVTTLDRLLEFATVEHHLRFNTTDVRTAIAVSLLEPFEQQSPSVATKERLKRFFLGYYGDPRLANRDAAAGWHGVPESARTVLMRWLAEETLEGFFRIVRETALDRHWRYRNVFWRAYFDRPDSRCVVRPWQQGITTCRAIEARQRRDAQRRRRESVGSDTRHERRDRCRMEPQRRLPRVVVRPPEGAKVLSQQLLCGELQNRFRFHPVTLRQRVGFVAGQAREMAPGRTRRPRAP
ncbi:MAG: EH signature domain-containing protein [Deltaproteobacteria bacterium]|nr:EH signature domain-containing protein [Deltaproteobacteria bacterium]